MNLKRLVAHILYPKLRAKLLFSTSMLNSIEEAVHESENKHLAELRFAVEGALAISDLWRNIPSREKALELFSSLRVWDTEFNCGVLIYIQLADRTVEIIADRGINSKVAPDFWQNVSSEMTNYFKRGEFKIGSIWAINTISVELIKHFPKDATSQDSNELSNRPVLI